METKLEQISETTLYKPSLQKRERERERERGGRVADLIIEHRYILLIPEKILLKFGRQHPCYLDHKTQFSQCAHMIQM
jgi:hypothetical protein